MNRKIKWLLAPAIVAALIAAMAPWTVSSHALRRELAAQVKAATGLATRVGGHATFSLLPRPRIKLDDVTFKSPDASVSLRARAIKGNLRILPLLTGRLELASLTLFSPHISVDLDKSARIVGAIAKAAQRKRATTASGSARLGIISIVSGTAHLESAAGAHRTVLRNVDATLDWPNLAAPATLNGTARWRGAEADLALWINKPAALLNGNPSSIDLKLESALGALTMDGSFASRPELQYEGHIAAYAPLLRRAMRLFDLSVPLPGRLRDARLTAQSRIDEHSLALSKLHFELDGNAFEGSLAMDKAQGRTRWSGTLATDLFALAPFLAGLRPAVTSDGQWNRDPIGAGRLDLADLDLRLSASRAHLGPLLLENAGVSILLTNGKLEITLADAKAYGGTVKVRANVSPGPAGLDLQVAGNFAHVDSAAFLSDALQSAHVSGEATGQVTLEGHGQSLAEIMRSLAARGQFKLGNGEVSGVDLEQALRRMANRPLSIAIEVHTGRTRFSSASCAFHVAAGKADMNRCIASGLGVALAMTGSAEIGQRSLDLHVVARQTGTEANGPSAPKLHLDLMGPWDDPVLVLDSASLIRRSAVAAPLLRSLGSLPSPAGGPSASAASTTTP